MDDLALIIGSKTYSSWSLRPWLAMVQAGIPFKEVVIPLRRADSKPSILRYAPSGKVPVLHQGALIIGESLAICEYAAELRPEALLWPANPRARAEARSVSAEMHAGFADLRSAMPMNLRQRFPAIEPDEAVAADILRITGIWRELRSRYGAEGPYLFGQFSIADAMFAPVCTRFRTYSVPVDDVTAAYMETMFSLPALQRWYAEAAEEL